jgi:dinuclear metal center YbgI/SA1388 family protein
VLRVRDVVGALEARYRPTWAESWDAVGLTCGDPEAPVRRVLLAVDPVAAVVDEALAWGADLVVTHHPLLLAGVHSVAADTPKGRLVHRLLSAGVALATAHTNADVARPGVSDALADALGVLDTRPLAVQDEPIDKLVTFAPPSETQRLLDALAAAGAGRIGAYERCGYLLTGTGTFRPLPGATPLIGSVGRVELVEETRVEMVVPRAARRDVLAALRAVHPYDEPAVDVYELAPVGGVRGLGRIGTLPQPETLEDLLVRVADGLPSTVAGVRAAGDPERVVQSVAVCGGSGDSLLDAVRAAGADAYVTADLRHHRASEAVEAGGPALVDVAHWASEWPWLPQAASLLLADLGDPPVETRASTLCTDPWTLHGETVPPIDPEDP